MNAPISHGGIAVAPALSILASEMPVPGLGALPVNAYLIEGAEPVLVDTGLPALAGATMDALASRIDPAELRWIWLTHCDADHVGALEPVLAAAPRARIATNYLGMGKLSMRFAIPPERFYLINPGQELAVGDRALRAVSLPSYDAPETMGLFDPRSRALFTSDCFGALLEEGGSFIEDAGAIDAGGLARGLTTWAMVDAPWLARIDGGHFRAALDALSALDAELVLSSHLPPARGMIRRLAACLDAARAAPAFVGPDQAALEQMLGAAA